jgi:RPA family protein
MPEENKQNQSQKRQVAYKLMIKDILDSKYIKEEGWNPNYLILKNEKQVSRINIIGTIINKQFDGTQNYQNVIIDDGTGNISLRNFENNDLIKDLNIGNSVLVIGKPREFGNQIYIVIEIIKKIKEPLWIELRKKELMNKIKQRKQNIEVYDVKEEIINEEPDIISFIKNLDKGDGVDIMTLIENSKEKNIERKINNMIKIGELFEIRPGKIKVLE